MSIECFHDVKLQTRLTKIDTGCIDLAFAITEAVIPAQADSFDHTANSDQPCTTIRNGRVVCGLIHVNTMANYKANSMNLMHESIEITDRTYVLMLSSIIQDRIAGV